MVAMSLNQGCVSLCKHSLPDSDSILALHCLHHTAFYTSMHFTVFSSNGSALLTKKTRSR